MRVKRFLSLLLCLSMILTLLPMISIPASAKGAPGMELGTKGIKGYNSTLGFYNYIYYGVYKDNPSDAGNPIKWRVLADTNGNGGTYKDKDENNVDPTNAMFLLSEYLLGSETSDLELWMQNCYNGAFSPYEYNRILKTSTSGDHDVGGSSASPNLLACQLNGNTLFALSADEATRSAYGLNNWDTTGETSGRVALINDASGSAGSWWLRSPLNNDAQSLGKVGANGYIDASSISSTMYARPALNLDKNAVLLYSIAAGGKSAPGMESGLAAVPTDSSAEWKLTLHDSSRNFGIWTTAVSADSVSFMYFGAKTGANEYISAVIVDDLDNILYYGRIKKVDASNEATINIPAGITLGDKAKLKVFNEQYNEDYRTDYASALQSVAENIVTYSLTNLNKDSNASPISVADGETFFAVLTANQGYMFPDPVLDSDKISVMVGGTASKFESNPDNADTAGEYSFDKTTGLIKVAKVNGPVVIAAEGVPIVSVSPANLDFGSMTDGYATAPDAQTVTIKNNGNSNITGYSITGGDSDYNVTYSSASIAAGGTSTFTVKPAAGLSAGVHAKTLTIQTAEGNTATVSLTFNVNTKPSSGGGGGSVIPPAPITEIKNGGSTTGYNLSQLVSSRKTLTVDGDKGAKLEFDTEALKGIARQASGDIKVEMTDVSSTHQESLPGKQVFSLMVSSGSSTITNFGGAVTVTLPYTLKDGETADKVTVWYLASDGTMTEIPCTYDPVTKLATFKVTHFSLYVVGVDASWVNPFTDVKDSDWFYGAVEFVLRNGMMKGIGGADFSPTTTVTRGMLVTVLWRLEKEPATTKTISFADVSDSKWYAKAVTWAAASGIASGIGGNQFAPDNSLTREQLAVMLFNYAKYNGLNVSVGENTNILSYNDALTISDYAYSALQWTCGAGIIKGDGNGKLNPQSSATRAEVAAMLQRFIEKVSR